MVLIGLVRPWYFTLSSCCSRNLGQGPYVLCCFRMQDTSAVKTLARVTWEGIEAMTLDARWNYL